jgi:uncharacterized Tic20 family protein
MSDQEQGQGGAPEMEPLPAPEVTPPPGPTGQEPAEGALQEGETMWAMLCHLLPLANFIVWIPFGMIVGPLVIWLIKKDTMPLVDDQGKEALNFQITMVIGMIVSAILIYLFIGLLLLPAVIIVDIIFAILAAVAASKGERYRYPIIIRFIK